MALFNEDSLRTKLADLNLSQQSIQTLSLWLIHHKKRAGTVVSVWAKEIVKVSSSRKLTFMYLANDVIQNSKKKGPEYSKEFVKYLPKVFEHLGATQLDEKAKRGLSRLLDVWESREIFNHSALHSFRRSYEGLKSISIKVDNSDDEEYRPVKRRKRSNSSSFLTLDSDSEEEGGGREATTDEGVGGTSPLSKGDASPEEKVPPPDPEVLMQALQSLETAASADADIRKKIANLPNQVSDPSCLSKLNSAKEGEDLLKMVTEALSLLLVYNGRLAEEMETRKNLSKMLHDFILYQKDKLAQTEETLEQYRQKLSKVVRIKAELKAHLQNLPDISRLPNMSSSLAPLPSAGDLFH